jgi:asparagine synthase (glutamine-hydrolysing)
MCGIVGITDFRSNVDPDLLRKAADTLRMRGPDDAGVWVSKNVGLAHRRLAVIDLSPAGHQPMVSADGRYVIVFNGEIYNFRELRKSLGGDSAEWRSQSDTETILAAYAKWGPACLERFHGMFAFAIWDRLNQAMFAARDRMGVKPFYYHHAHDGFAFASRPRALLRLNPSWGDSLDDQALRFYMESGYIPAPYSIFSRIRKLPPAHWLMSDESGLEIRRYWDFRQVVPERAWERRKEADLLDELNEILARSVRSRMVSDAPLGAFLSGGIDSSTVVAMMARHSAHRVKTFTIGFEERAYDESQHAEAVARHLGTEHFCERMSVDDLLALKPTFAREFDEPFFDSSAYPAMAVSHLARKHVTVSLSGDGGDELFGGYHYYRIARALDRFYNLPQPARKLVARGVASFPQHRMKLLSATLNQPDAVKGFCFARSIAKDFQSLLTPNVLRHTMGMTELLAETARSLPAGLKTPEIAMRLDAFYTLPDDYLQKVDVASMAFSLESREPMLDQDLVEWSMKLPLKWKLRGSTNKYLLRKLAYRYVARPLLNRPKKGFEVPIADWLRGPLNAWVCDAVNDPRNFETIPFDRARLIELVKIHRSRARQSHPLLWAALVHMDFINGLPENSKAMASV